MPAVLNDVSNLPSAEIVEYRRNEVATFRKVDERWGGFSNMAPGFSLVVEGVRIKTSEALYQACRFPHLPEIQSVILQQASPMAAKMKSKPHRRNSRPDFEQAKVEIMRWSLRVKLACNLKRFGELLVACGDLPIVEDSRKDAFWGAVPHKTDPNRLLGANVLGRLLMELRDEFKKSDAEAFATVFPPDLPDFKLCDRIIGMVTA